MKYKMKMSGTFEHEMEIEAPHEDYVRTWGPQQMGKIPIGKLDKVVTNPTTVVPVPDVQQPSDE